MTNLDAGKIVKVAVSAGICCLTAASLFVLQPSVTRTQLIEESKPLDTKIEIQDTPVSSRSPSRQQQEIKCLKEALWHEARGEGEDGLKAVLTVIINRKNHPDYPATFCRVIRQPKQFSYVHERLNAGLSLEPKAKEPEEKRLLTKVDQLAHAAVQGRFDRTLPRAVLWYHSTAVKPGWARQKAKVARVGRHLFYQKKGENV